MTRIRPLPPSSPRPRRAGLAPRAEFGTLVSATGLERSFTNEPAGENDPLRNGKDTAILDKTVWGTLRFLLLSLWLAGGLTAGAAHAALDAVSGVQDGDPPELTQVLEDGDPTLVAYSLANGFPLWYRDADGLKLQLCLDQAVERADGGIFLPCPTEEPLPGAPISFPLNFGAEAFWWLANAAGVYTSRQDGVLVAGGDMLFVGALEAAFAADLGAQDGDQVGFARIRLRISVPRPGIYRVTHPYGTFTYAITDPGRRAINQTQDIGNFFLPGPPPLGDFTRALPDGEAPFGGGDPPLGFDFSLNAGVVDEDGRSIGPFLVAADEPGGDPLNFIEAVDGSRYLADPGAGALHLEVPVTGSPTGDNFFRLELLALLEQDELGAFTVEVDPAAREFFLNAADDSQVVTVTRFQIMGKLFDDRPNLPPTAEPVAVATARNTPLTIDVSGHVRDELVPGVNEHGIKAPLHALGLPTDPTDLLAEIRLARPLTTREGGTVQRFTSVSSGVSTFRYTPPAGFTGLDAFHYVVQDEGGLISAPAEVTVIVEDLQALRAEFRPRTGTWRLEGTSSQVDGNTVELFAAPHAELTGDAVQPAPVATAARGLAALGLSSDRVDVRISLDPLPATPVIFLTLHVAPVGATTGPAVLFLFDSAVDGPFPGSFQGFATASNFLPRPAAGVNTFDDVLAGVLEGRAYLNVYTVQHSFGAGELRGDIALPPLGTVAVTPGVETGEWRFEGKAPAGPGAFREVHARSAGGVTVLGFPLRLR
ncbi:MAG: CHRD domain-containing protein [Deferrisomatales bacterium]|nr:CHRD domain-containing protein [Deferrisomatales bacterium]